MNPGAFLVLMASAASLYAENAAIPERLPLDRYQKLKNEAPFAVATAEAVVETPTVPWSKGLYLSSAMKVWEEGAQTDLVTITNTNEPGTLIRLIGDQVNDQGMQIVKLDWSEDAKLTKVTVKKGTEFATLERDGMAYKSPMPLQPNQPPPRGNIPGQPPRTVMPNGAGSITPPNTVPRPVIPRPQGVAPATQPSLPQPVQGGQPQGAADRRRIRVINSK